MRQRDYHLHQNFHGTAYRYTVSHIEKMRFSFLSFAMSKLRAAKIPRAMSIPAFLERLSCEVRYSI
jgi:hypothetical protein